MTSTRRMSNVMSPAPPFEVRSEDNLSAGAQVSSIDFILIQLTAYPGELQSDQLEALLFEAFDDLADESTLDAVRLDHDKSTLLVGHRYGNNGEECQDGA